uniref:Uncharacterized protein n=1 Tax=Anguilla anguilla TaxID=7936 RepID=A0A0E9VA47_ANGAN
MVTLRRSALSTGKTLVLMIWWEISIRWG